MVGTSTLKGVLLTTVPQEKVAAKMYNQQQFSNVGADEEGKVIANCSYCHRNGVELFEHKCPTGSIWSACEGYLEIYMNPCKCESPDDRSLVVRDSNDPPGVVNILVCESCSTVVGDFVS